MNLVRSLASVVFISTFIFSLSLEGLGQRKISFRKPARKKQKGGVVVIPIPAKKLVEIKINGKLFTSYRYSEDIKKPVLWPIISASGHHVTRGYPIKPMPGERVDHPHHVGLWFNHGEVNGHDFWNNSNKIGKEHKGPFGQIVHRTIDNYTSSKDKGELMVSSDWLNQKGQTILSEKTHFIFEVNKNQRWITRIANLTAGSDTVFFEDNKEGMLGLRVARFLELPSNKPEIFLDGKGNPTEVPVMNNLGVTGNYFSSNGVTGDSVWGKRANWVMLNGGVADSRNSIIIFDDAGNHNYPGHWHARGYGLFALNSIGSKVFTKGAEHKPLTILPGQTVVFKYRILIVSGEKPNSEQINLWSEAKL